MTSVRSRLADATLASFMALLLGVPFVGLTTVDLGGRLVVQSLLPGQGTFAHHLRRLALKLVGFDQKVALLARRHPECGIAKVLSLLSPGLPRRLPAEQVLAVLRDIGLTLSRTVTDGQTLYLVARSPLQQPTRPSPTPELCAESQGS